jgi:hypothetical protein
MAIGGGGVSVSRLGVTIISYRRLMASKTALSIVRTSARAAVREVAVAAAHCGGFALLAAVGALGLSAESGVQPHLARAVELRELFALLLFALVIARCLWGFKVLTRASHVARRDFDRRSARIVYQLLYVLVGVQLILDMSSTGQLHTGHCQAYVGIGIVAVLLIRAVSAALCRAPATP